MFVPYTDACTLTFDMNTAAKSIFLHNGGKQVTWVREEQPYQNHPERFESVSQVLCDKGLTKRHYWEVEWQGHWVDVAVAKRGIRRRAGSHLCGFGYTDQSWSLYCSDDHYSAHHDHQSVEIPAPPSHTHRVGVYLDWPGGTLSFYSVSSGTFSHLHTFYSTFTEPLYPGFGMQEDDCSVIICPVKGVPELISRSASAERLDEFWVQDELGKWFQFLSRKWSFSEGGSNAQESYTVNRKKENYHIWTYQTKLQISFCLLVSLRFLCSNSTVKAWFTQSTPNNWDVSATWTLKSTNVGSNLRCCKLDISETGNSNELILLKFVKLADLHVLN